MTTTELRGVEEYIILEPDPRLHEVWPEADFATTHDTLRTMLAMSNRGASDGRSLGGLSSVQVELPGRAVTYKRWTKGGFGGFINPKVAGQSKRKVVGVEGCFSLGMNRWWYVERPTWVLIMHDTAEDAFKFTKLEGYEARFALHEIDHINGILISDIGQERT